VTTPAWQPGTRYVPGSLVRRSSAPPPTAQEITNPGFELGALTGWTTDGSGWAAGTTPYGSGVYSARWEPSSVSGTNGIGRLIATTAAPCRPGQSITASCMVKQGAASAGNAGGRVQLNWYDSLMSVLSVSDGSNVNNSDSGNWRKSTVTATAPANAAYVAIGSRCFQEELGKKVHVDTFAWDHAYADNNSAGLVFRAVQAAAGYSGATEPTWPNVLGVQVVDNEVTWEAVDSAYVTWEAVPILKSGTVEQDWPEQVGAAVDDGTVRWVAVTRRVEDEKCPNTTAVVIAASKVFAVDDDIIGFCATVNPLDWSTTEDAGYLPFGLQAHGSNPAMALGLYRSNLVAFNSEGFQMWQDDQDPANMALLDAAPIGSTEPRAMQPVYNDLLFLSAVGVRNLSIAAGSTNLQAGSIGEPIDVLVKAQIDAGTYTPISLTYPSAGQYWLIFGPQAFVFTSVSSGKGTWSRYVFPGAITDATLLGSVLYLRGASGEVWKFSDDETADDVYCQGEAPVLISADEYGLVADLAWTYDYPEFDAVTFLILRSVDGSLFAQIGTVSGDTYTYSDDTVELGRTYTYAIVARPDPLEAIDSPMSNTLSIELPAVAPAPVLTATLVSDDADLDWTAAGSLTGSTITGYQVWRSTAGGEYTLIHTTADGVTLTYLDEGLTPDVLYAYYIVAVSDEETVSPNSNIETVVYSTNIYLPAYWINGGAEYTDLTAWTTTAGGPYALNNTWNYPREGTWFFVGGSSLSSKIYQRFAVADTGMDSAIVDAGNAELVVDWYGGTYDQSLNNPTFSNDQPALNVRFRNAALTVIGTHSSGYKDPATRYGSTALWDQYQEVVDVPVGTRHVDIELEFNRLSGTNNDAKFDGVQPYLREV
jgi:hypothetical protein